MIIKSISLCNFIGYRNQCEIDFSGRRVIGVVGSNESGKSSILQAFSYALFGRTRAKRELHLINDDAKGPMVVELCVELPDGEVLQITRGRTQQNEPILRVAGMGGGPSDIAEQLAKKVRLSYEDYIALSYFMQGDIHQFMSSNKREYFQRWTKGLAIWKQLEDSAKLELRGWEDTMRAASMRIIDLGEDIEREGEVRACVKKNETLRNDAHVALKDAEEALHSVQAAIAAQDTIAELSSELSDGLREMVEHITEIDRRLLRVDYDIGGLEETLKQLTSGRCPMLDIYCEDLELVSTQQREGVNYDKVELKKEQGELEKKRTALDARIKQAQKKIDAIPERDSKYELIDAEVEHRDKKGKAARADRWLADARADLRRVEAAKRQLATHKQQANDAEVECRRWAFLKYMCGKSGVPAVLLSQELVKVEEKCNWILERLEYPKQIRFSGQTILSGYEKICPVCGGELWRDKICVSCRELRPRKMKDEPAVTVIDGQHERPFALESGGAQVLQSFAVRLACSMFVAGMTGIPLRMVMLDETFAMLDADNRQKLLSLVVDKLASTFNLEQQFVVSHHDDIIGAVDNLLLVTKEHGSSIARWA